MRTLLCLLLAAAPASAQVTYQHLLRADPDNWLSYSGAYHSRRHSLLGEIHAGNVEALVPKWVYHIQGASRLENFSTAADCQSTLECLRRLGVAVRRENAAVVIDGLGLDGLQGPAQTLDAGNSGSTIRMLAGILAGQRFGCRISGDESLCRRPMRRVIEPLAQMGARLEAREGNFPPLEITGGALRGIQYRLPVPSAQVKTAILFAGLYAAGDTVVEEPVPTRDHTEIALRQFGAEVAARRRAVCLTPGRPLRACQARIPSDLSSAAYFLAACLLVPGSELFLEGIGLNPTRSALLDVLAGMGATLRILEVREESGEMVGDLAVRHSALEGGIIQGETTAALIDEIPVLAVLGAASRNGLLVRDAAELRVKESDRIATVTENLKRLGVQVSESEDGFQVQGRARFRAASLDSFGDHRIAMACAVAALRAEGPCTIQGAEAASVSFPEFYQSLENLRS